MLADGARTWALAANRRGGFDEAGHALKLAADRIGHLGVEDEQVQAVAELLMQESGVFARQMAPRDMKARHFAAYAATYSREPGGRARKRRS